MKMWAVKIRSIDILCKLSEEKPGTLFFGTRELAEAYMIRLWHPEGYEVEEYDVEKQSKATFDSHLTKWHNFYGCDGNCFKLGDVVFEAVENEDDGYRSMLQEVRVRDSEDGCVFFQQPVAIVRMEETSDNGEESDSHYTFDGYRLIDTDGHVWLTFGTDNNDDYYPWFVCRYTPKAVAE